MSMSAKKTRFDGLDVTAMTSHLKHTMLGFKLVNIYDGSALGFDGGTGGKTYLFKLADASGGQASASSAHQRSDPGRGGGGGGDASAGEAATGVPQQDATAPLQSTEATAQQGAQKAMLLIESGVRFHPTSHYSQSSSAAGGSMPSPFAMKLRKHLRHLRLENVTQLGRLDRVVDFRFGSAGRAHHLLLELYAQGNLVLCDGEYRILALLRTHEYAGEGGATEEVKVRVGNVYPVTFATTLTAAAASESNGSENSNGGEGGGGKATAATSDLLAMDGAAAYEWAKAELLAVQERSRAINDSNAQNQSEGKKKGGKGKTSKKRMDESVVLKNLLLKPNSGVYHYGPSLIEHCLLTAGLDPVTKLTCDGIKDVLPAASWDRLVAALREEGARVIGNLTAGDGGGCGYVLYKPKEPKAAADEQNNNEKDAPPLSSAAAIADRDLHLDKTLREFQPHLLRQHAGQARLRHASFAVAVDEFFGCLSSQRAAARAEAAEAAARNRLARVRLDQERRVRGLVAEQDRWRDAARLVEVHAEDVDRALGVITGALETGMDWEALEALVSVEKGNENPIALLIHKLALDKDEVVLALPDIDNWDPDQDEVPSMQNVTVNIKESAHGNARNMFANYRASKEKEAKTMEASTMALKAAEAKARLQLAEAQKNKARIQSLPSSMRKSYWFEKFAWFITSDNYLVVAGKDAQQNEQLVKRYLRPGDAFLHAEVHGAATCLLRAKRRRRGTDGRTQVLPLSDQALREAGHFTICRSSAWASKMVTSAYWVEAHQVSKTAPTGEYLSVGSFMIRGRKNFLPASALEMGLGVLFKLGEDPASLARHANERRDFALLEQVQSLAQEEHNENEKKKEEIEPAVESLMSKDEPSNPSTFEKLSIDEDISVGKQMDEDEVRQKESSREAEQPESSSTPDKNQVSFAENQNSSLPPKNHAPKNKKQKELPRGKRSKNKRAKKKYAEQDDEDRELAMLALHGNKSSSSSKKGSKKGSRIVAVESETQQKAADETRALLQRDSEKVASDILDANLRQVLAECVTVRGTTGSEEGIVRWNKFDAEVLEQLGDMDTSEKRLAAAHRLLDLSKSSRIDNFSASLAGIIRTIRKHGCCNAVGQNESGKQRKSKAKKQAEKEAWQQILAEDGVIEYEEGHEAQEDAAVDDTAELIKLTGKPTAEDVILGAIPVCAPYSVLSQYKYRVKLTPGSVKRGKASKQTVELLLGNHESGGKKKQQMVDTGTKRDHALIKLVNENDWVQVMIGDVRITSAGASKVTKNQKGKARKKC